MINLQISVTNDRDGQLPLPLPLTGHRFDTMVQALSWTDTTVHVLDGNLNGVWTVSRPLHTDVRSTYLYFHTR